MLTSDSDPALTFTFDTYDELSTSSLINFNKKITVFEQLLRKKKQQKIGNLLLKLTSKENCAFVVVAVIVAVVMTMAIVCSSVFQLLPLP